MIEIFAESHYDRQSDRDWWTYFARVRAAGRDEYIGSYGSYRAAHEAATSIVVRDAA